MLYINSKQGYYLERFSQDSLVTSPRLTSFIRNYLIPWYKNEIHISFIIDSDNGCYWVIYAGFAFYATEVLGRSIERKIAPLFYRLVVFFL